MTNIFDNWEDARNYLERLRNPDDYEIVIFTGKDRTKKYSVVRKYKRQRRR